MRLLLAVVLLSCVAACGQPQPAHDQTPATGIRDASPTLHIEDAWAAPTPGGVDVSAGYFTIVNGTDASDRLLSASSPRAEHVDLHEMAMDGAVMQMRMIPSLPIAAHDQATLSPGGRHMMFVGVKQPFTPGEQIPLDLTFEHAGKIHVTLDVRVPS